MNIQIETIHNLYGGKHDVIRDVDKVRKLIAITEKVMNSVRDFPCGHKPNGVSGKCAACDALMEWDALSANS